MVRTGNKNTMAQWVESVNGQKSVIILLHRREKAGYSFPVAAKSATGRENPFIFKATQTPLASFFIVAASVHPYSAALIRTESMVALAGLTSVRPGSLKTGILTPVRATTILERENSGGSKFCYFKEIDACQRPLPKHTRNLSGSFWPFAVLICVINHTASRLQPPTTTPPAALWRVISWLPLPGVCRPGGLPHEPRPEARYQPARFLPTKQPVSCLPWAGKPAYHAGCRHARHTQPDATGRVTGCAGGGDRASHGRMQQRADQAQSAPQAQGLNRGRIAMFRIVITTDEYHEAQLVSSAFLVWHIEYNTHTDAVDAAEKLECGFSIPDSPTRYITTTRIIEVNHA